MRRIIKRLTLAIIMLTGLCIGVVKGQDARIKWMNKMKGRGEEKRSRSGPQQVLLDEFEIQSFHN